MPQGPSRVAHQGQHSHLRRAWMLWYRSTSLSGTGVPRSVIQGHLAQHCSALTLSDSSRSALTLPHAPGPKPRVCALGCWAQRAASPLDTVALGETAHYYRDSALRQERQCAIITAHYAPGETVHYGRNGYQTPGPSAVATVCNLEVRVWS